ncbi:unnamed protein product [Closterium sp. NIES-53]
MLLGTRVQWAREHPPPRAEADGASASPRPVNNKGDGGNVVGEGSTRVRGMIQVANVGVGGVQARVLRSTAVAGSSNGNIDGRRQSPQRSGARPTSTTHASAEIAGLKKFVNGKVEMPDEDTSELLAEFCAAHLLTFMVLSRCCSPLVQVALKPCRLRVDAGYQAWQYIMRTYKATDDLYISQLEKKLATIRMGKQESATEYCNRARRILADMQMAGFEYSVASYVTHVINGLPSSYNLMRRMLFMPGARETLNEDLLSSHIIQDEFMQESERSSELLSQANYVAPTKQGRQTGQRGKSGGGGGSGGKLSNTNSTEGADRGKSVKGNDRVSSGSRRGGRRCYICGDPDHLSYDCPDHVESDDDHRGSRSGKEASCSMVGVVEPTISLAPEAGEDLQAVAAVVQANPSVVLLDSGCSHHLMGTREAFVDMKPGGEIRHLRGFNGALQHVEGRGTVAQKGETGQQILIPDMLYVRGVQANLLSAGQLKENCVKLQNEGDEMLLVSAARDVLSQACYTCRVLCTDLRPCSSKSPTSATEAVALRTIVSATKSKPVKWHARLAHVDTDTIMSSAKHEVAIGLDIEKSSGADVPCTSCVGGKLARHTLPEKGSDAETALEVVHIDLCSPFRVAAMDGSLYFLLLKDRKTRFTSKSVKRLRSDRGGEFLGRPFTDLVEDKGILHNLTCPYTPQQNGMAEREMRTVVEAVRTMLLHMGVKHHWWHLALRHAIWVRKCLERASLPPRTTPYELLLEKKPDLTLARVWGCMVQFMLPEQLPRF